MDYEWDTATAEANRAKHGVSFDAVHEFQWDTAIERLDDSEDYGEERWIAIGFIRGVLHVLVYTARNEITRVMSLRRATKLEQRIYAKA